MNNYSSGRSLLSHAEVISISFFALLTIVIVLLVVLFALVCNRHKWSKSTRNLRMTKPTFTMYYNHSTPDYAPSNATTTSPSHSSHGPVSSVELLYSQRVGLGSSDNATNDVSVPILSSIPFNEFNRDSARVWLHSVIPEEVQEEEEERDRKGPQRESYMHVVQNESDIGQGDSGYILQSMTSAIDISIPEEEELKVTSEEPTYTNTSSDDGMFSQNSTYFDETNLSQCGWLQSGDSGVGQSLSPEKSLMPRRVSLTQGAPPLSLGEDHDVDDVRKNLSRNCSVSDTKVHRYRRHSYSYRNSAVQTIGRSSYSAKKQYTGVPPSNSLSRDMSSHSQPQPSQTPKVGSMDLSTREGDHPHHPKSPRLTFSEDVTERPDMLLLQFKGGMAHKVSHASTLQQRLKDSQPSPMRRSKAWNRPSREKLHYNQRHTETYRSTGDNLHPKKKTVNVDCKDTFSSTQYSHHQSLSQTYLCKSSTEEMHTYTLPRNPQCEPRLEAGSTPPFKPPVIVPKCIRPTATLQDCTSDGREYTDEANGFTLTLGKGAIARGDKLTIDIGVALHGPFSYPAGTRPISPVFWICVRGNEFYIFKKPVDITFQHFLHISSEEERARMGVSFVKAYHTPNHEGKYAFRKVSDCQAFKPNSRYGTVLHQ